MSASEAARLQAILGAYVSDVTPEDVASPAIQRMIEDVRLCDSGAVPRESAGPRREYNRYHNRHNRSIGPYSRFHNRHNRGR